MSVDVNAPARMDLHEKMRLRRAAFQVTRLDLGPVGEMVAKELLAWEEFGWRLAGEGIIARIVDWVEKQSPAP